MLPSASLIVTPSGLVAVLPSSGVGGAAGDGPDVAVGVKLGVAGTVGWGVAVAVAVGVNAGASVGVGVSVGDVSNAAV
jgi:hypothetical protein